MFDSILVICTGNICRSPIGERLLRLGLPKKKIESAGVGALVNHSADSSAIKVAEKHGISLEGHLGTQFTSQLARQYDLLLVMEHEHLVQVSRIAPEVRGKTMLFGHWLENNKDIPDPYRKSDEAFESVYQLIEQASKHWIAKLGG
ncbi:protein tyrosine phosphatase [Pluralibacter gergoviae]|uniref:arsenate reductase/protein-tyrosine-phosphatase family protein n=1 Tax=Pluralibacter gergoviae TaxID=61647 RepID=UPI00090829AC|nr:protein tyrosine phosphatase [Pluralibacter gergoviae]ELG9929445.1 protein tyrosine phosphatase [Pluralibacter gergoviae]ELK5591848.1 protein tyrosine phosphatase [Pluralibacter gergoviae]MDU4432653.1 protein tyrosine phosphatase [Pluralibacter gergoviae]OUR03696.1 protein tyrosine phosphatase [Pluralibacter gergoviae]PHH46706.1 protein tyrosine phosphatase [Pluralibacter gergoviae]